MTKRKKSKQSAASQKRPRNSNSNSNGNGNGPPSDFDASRGYIDPATGQRGAFPGLEKYQEDFYGPPLDGIDYLRMVRSEAKGVPSLLLSTEAKRKGPKPQKSPLPPPPKSTPDDVVLDYEDSPAACIPASETEEDVGDLEDDCVLFEESTSVSLVPSLPGPKLPPSHYLLISRFRAWRAQLLQNPPQLEHYQTPSLTDQKTWRSFAASTFPRPGWVWGLQQDEVLQLLGNFGRWLEWRIRVRNAVRRGVARGWGVWIYALLAKCEEAMEAGGVWVVRALGKAAIQLRRGIGAVVEEGAGADTDNLEFSSDEGDDAGAVEKTNGDAAEREESEEEGEIPDGPPPQDSRGTADGGTEFYGLADTMVMMDMIVSVIGDFFGQRDLLGERAEMGW